MLKLFSSVSKTYFTDAKVKLICKINCLCVVNEVFMSIITNNTNNDTVLHNWSCHGGGGGGGELLKLFSGGGGGGIAQINQQVFLKHTLADVK